jgi:hypothetical protein
MNMQACEARAEISGNRHDRVRIPEKAARVFRPGGFGFPAVVRTGALK